MIKSSFIFLPSLILPPLFFIIHLPAPLSLVTAFPPPQLKNKCTLQVLWLHAQPYSERVGPRLRALSLLHFFNFRSKYPCGDEILLLHLMNAKKRRVTQCECVCGPESDAKKQYSLITEQMDNMSAFDLFVFRKWE